MFIKVPKNGSIKINIKNGIIYSLNVEDEESKVESLLEKAKEEINPQCLQCKHIVLSCAGCFKEDSFDCTHFSLDEDAIERIKLFYQKWK